MDDDTWHLQVKVNYCVTGLRADCDLRVSGEVSSYWREHYWILLTNTIQVRACHGDTSAQEVSSGDSVYYVYRLVSVPTACQWGYCAYTNYNGPSWRICYKYFVFHVSSQPQYNQCNVTSQMLCLFQWGSGDCLERQLTCIGSHLLSEIQSNKKTNIIS